jgi:valyl-tRNA synthetase
MELAKAYSHKDVEARWYKHWMESGAFEPPGGAAPYYSIVIPPPNVTGSLHMGHALNNTLQDILCRYKRMDGFRVLWVPGTDHAGIATQNVVERQLAERGLTRAQLGREKFIERVWQWKGEAGNTWAFPAIGSMSDSPWMRVCPWRCARPSSGFGRTSSCTGRSG